MERHWVGRVRGLRGVEAAAVEYFVVMAAAVPTQLHLQSDVVRHQPTSILAIDFVVGLVAAGYAVEGEPDQEGQVGPFQDIHRGTA